jgi:predicted transcriptional regulator
MKNYECPRKIFIESLFSKLGLKSSEVAKAIPVSQSVVTRYCAGEKKNSNLDKYLLVKIKEYLENAA